MQNRSLGVSVAEYALLGALLAVLGIAGLEMLGGSVSGLFTHSENRLASANTLSLLDVSPSAASVPVSKVPPQSNDQSNGWFKGGGYYAMVSDPATGKPMLKIVDGTAGEVKNVSSVDGNQLNALGTLLLARKLDELSNQQTDPELKDYYGQMARMAYYMGANEGELDDVPGLQVTIALNGTTRYSNGSALKDLFSYKTKMDALMNNPPSGLDMAEFSQVMPLASEVHNIAQNYMNSLSSLISPTGEVVGNFKLPKDLRSGFAPGSSVRLAQDMQVTEGNVNKSYEQYVSYDTLKTTVTGVLNNYQDVTQPVKTTLTDAVEVDTHARNQ